MLYFHKELKEILKSDYQIQKSVSNNEYYKIENGLYSDKEFVNLLEIICKKYPNSIFPSDYYKELISGFRKKADKIDIYKIQEYISNYKNERYIDERGILNLLKL